MDTRIRCVCVYFNPRSPCGERHCTGRTNASCMYFNPRSPCGERPLFHTPINKRGQISIHAPLAGSDVTVSDGQQLKLQFQSTLPLRGATHQIGQSRSAKAISIHAPLAGSDTGLHGGVHALKHFNPRSPCGERPRLCAHPKPR